MHNSKVLLGALLVMFLTGGVFVGHVNSASSEPINIGMVTSLTGPYSFMAKEQRNGGEIAVAKINKEGGVLGER